MSLKNYKTLIFDCDGVLLNSNKIKTQAFYDVTKHYGHKAAQELTDYHKKNGGISRYKKFEHFLTVILNKPFDQVEIDNLADSFACEVKQALMNCEIAEGLETLRQKTRHARWLVVSGGDQSELREVFERRGLAELADGGIYGSPDSKDEILARELNCGNIIMPTLFIGDSKYDYRAAQLAGLDFLFLSGWSEVEGWEEWCGKHKILSEESIKVIDEHH